MKQLKEAFESDINQHIPYMFEESMLKRIEREMMVRKMEKIEKKAHFLTLLFFLLVLVLAMSAYFIIARVTIIDIPTIELGVALTTAILYIYCFSMNPKMRKE